MAETEVSQRTQNSAFMQALGAEFSMLQGARGATISESASRSGLYMTTLSGAVVALALVAQASKFGVTFFIFALAILPVVFFLGVVTYYRLLETGVEDVIYARASARSGPSSARSTQPGPISFKPLPSTRSAFEVWVCGAYGGSNFCLPPRPWRS